MNFSDLVGMTMRSVTQNNEEIVFETIEGKRYMLYHEQDCCEGVFIEDVNGDLNDLVGEPILRAEESASDYDLSNDQMVVLAATSRLLGTQRERNDESSTWTFYKLATIKGTVVIRWYGSSNGYYSESVDFKEVL